MDKPTQPSNNKSDKNIKNWLAYSGMVFEMFAIIGIFTVGGYFLDKKLHTTPVLVIIFVMTGLGISFYRIYKQMT